MRFTKVRVSIPRGSKIGAISPRGLNCAPPWDYLPSRTVISMLESDEMKENFDSSMESLGYDVTGRSDILFDEEDDILRTLYSVGARVTDIKIDLCDNTVAQRLLLSEAFTGEAYLKIEWTIYDQLNRRTVYKTTTEGYSNLALASREGVGLLLDDAFAGATHNLGADETFHSLITFGLQPKNQVQTEIRNDFVFEDRVYINRKALSTTPIEKHMENTRKAAVVVSAGDGHGSGFFLGNEGYILTNQHVVGNAHKARIETADKTHQLIGTVLRRHKVQDVALIKLDDIPSDLKVTALPVRKSWPKVGEEVYAIGAPKHRKRLSDTVTKGIISAHRKNYEIFGTRMNLLQADVSIHGGNSGGPLLDSNGNIIGLSAAGVSNSFGDSLGGLNFFVPIEEAFDKLDIEY
ncbi:MAG: S1C family serine protease [Pseudomonadota bacterium]